MLGEEGDGLAALLGGIVEGGVDLAEDGFQCRPDHLVLDEELSERCADHDHDTWPEKPVTGRRGVAITKAAERGEGHVVVPDGVFRVVGLANAFAVVDQKGSDETPGEKGADEHGDGGVETDEHAGADEGGSPFYEPAPILDVDGPVRVA